MRTILLVAIMMFFSGITVEASEMSQSEINEKRMEFYKKTETATGVPWFYLAAIDQYERSIRNVRKDLPKPNELLGIYIQPEHWTGITNPDKQDINPKSISFFNGLGQDGTGDGMADPNHTEDVLFTIGNYIAQYGTDDTRFRLALWNYYKRDKTVGAIMSNTQVYRKMNRINLDEKAFPIPKGYNYSYRNTWGDRRGWGGRRIHEGTDIFAGYGTPVRAAAYGVVELKGWNKYGGWRVGIRDLNNTYHYYAHLNGFAKGLKIGDVVQSGEVIGSVGSSGYGPPGTSGKFPPHLHFGMYKDDGIKEWSFDPYPYLKVWERADRKG